MKHLWMKLDGLESKRNFFDKCLGMIEEWANLSLQCEPYISEYGKHQKRCHFAVNLALPSRRVEGNAGLMTQMINHHSGAIIQDLRGINLNEPEIRTDAGRRLFTCWMDFGLQRELVKTAQPLPPHPAQDIMQLPENVMASTPALPAATHSTLVPPTQPGTSTTSKAQRKLTFTWTGPVNLGPRFALITQLGTDLSISLTLSAGESTSVFNINAVPKSPARPIPSTSGSEAGSPLRLLRSSMRVVTPSPMKSSASTSNASQVAGRQGPATRSRSPMKSSGASLPFVPEQEP